MKQLLVSLAALAAFGAAPAFALNPQPLPPGLCAADAPHCLQPPDPCARYRAHPRMHARCLAMHPRPQNEGWERDRGRAGVTEPPDPCHNLTGKAFARCRMQARNPPKHESIGSGTTGAGAGK